MKNIVLIETESGFISKFKNKLSSQNLDSEYQVSTIEPDNYESVDSIVESCLSKFKTLNSELKNIECVIVDIRIDESIDDDISGIHVSNKLKEIYPKLVVFNMSNYEDKHNRDKLYDATLELADGVFGKSYLIGNTFSASRLKTIILKANNKISLQCRKKEFKKTQTMKIGILTALDDPEFTAIKENFKSLIRIPSTNLKFNDSTEYYYSDDFLHYHKIEIYAATEDNMGLSSSSNLATKMIIQFDLDIIVILGICAGFESKTHIGDIIVGGQVWDYGCGKYIMENEDIKFIPYFNSINIEEDSLEKEIKKYCKRTDVLSSIKNETKKYFPNDTELNAKYGPFASGAAVIASNEKLKEIKSQHGQVIGFDMEAFGIYYAAKKSLKKPLAISIKAVSDFGNENKSTELKVQHQNYASNNSVLFFKKILLDVLIKCVK
jgi:nucleoside phosphorylase